MGKSQRGGSMKSTFNLNNFSNVAFCTQNRKTTVKPKHENTKKVQTVRSRSGICDNVLIAIISLIVLFVAVFIAYRYAEWQNSEQTSRKCNSKLRVLLIAPINSTSINHVFERLDYKVVHDTCDQWDVLWSTTAVAMKPSVTKFKLQQLVIQFPLDIVNISSVHHLRTFKLPEMKNEVMDSKGRRFITRTCFVNNVNYDLPSVLSELMRDPLIMNGSLVEMSAVALVASTNPLRIYRSRDDFHITFTPNFESLPKHFCLKSLENEKSADLLLSHKKELDDNVDNAMVETILLNEQHSNRSRNPPNSLQITQLMQFKFVIDTSFRVHIVDVKEFPDSNGKDEGSYERIIYGALKIAGAGNLYEFSCRESLECPMLSTLKDIVSTNSCFNYRCNESSCTSTECELCLPCLNQVPDALIHLHRSFREHMQRGNMRRIFPLKKHDDESRIVNHLSPANRLSIKWFRAKCDVDSTWC